MTWTHRLINGKGGDSGLLNTNTRSGEQFLFDAGALDALTERQLLRLSSIYLSHHHMDHTQGLQRWLRVRARHEQEEWLRIVGPQGTRAALIHHVNSYTWNLLADDWFSFDVYECTATSITRSLVRFSSGAYVDFEEEVSSLPYGVESFLLDHDIDVLGYAVTSEETHVFAPPPGVSPGRWVGELKSRANQGDLNSLIETPEGEMTVAEGVRRYLQSRVTRFAYASDFFFTEENLQSCRSVASGFSNVFCEASFPADERQRAKRHRHLTTYQSALVAVLMGAENYHPFHLSPAFDQEATLKQAQQFFVDLRQSTNIDSLVAEELKRVSETPV